MNEIEIELVAMMLDELANILGDRSCNDMRDEWRSLFTEEEHAYYSMQYHSMNGDPQDDRGSLIGHEPSLVSLMAEKVRQHASKAR